jgi:probable F420-dependent oxidoreductase
MALRPFRFGVQTGRTATATEWLERAREAERLGYSTFTMPDHFTDQLAPVPALMAAASATTTLRVGALVLDNDFRHPALLAKELATMDLLSNGRVEIGLGAGWLQAEYDQAGLPYDEPKVRIDRLVEALAVIRGLMADAPLTFAGKYYTVSGLEGTPKPVQRPHPPILIGGGGRRVLQMAAREADIVGFNTFLRAGAVTPAAMASMRASVMDERMAWIRAAAGSRLDELELSVRVFAMDVTDDRRHKATELASVVGFGADDVLASPFALIGSAAQIVEDLRARRERWGLSYILVGSDDMTAFAPVVAELAGT